MFFGLFWGDWTLLIVMPAMIFAFWAQINVNSTFEKYSRVHNTRGLTGAQAARRILDANGLHHIRVERMDKPVILVGVCANEITDYETQDGKPVRVIVFIAADDADQEGYLSLLSSVSSKMRNVFTPPAALVSTSSFTPSFAIMRTGMDSRLLGWPS